MKTLVAMGANNKGHYYVRLVDEKQFAKAAGLSTARKAYMEEKKCYVTLRRLFLHSLYLAAF